MKGLFWRCSVRSARKRPGRTFATVAGIALGIVMIVATAIANRSALVSFQQLVTTVAGKAELQVLPHAGSGMPEAFLAEAQRADDIASAHPVVSGASPVIEDGKDVDVVLVYGVEPARDRSVREYDVVGGRWLRGGAETVVPAQWAEERGLAVGDAVDLLTAGGVRAFRVVGLISSVGIGSANAGRLTVVPIGEAQEMFDRHGRYDQIDVVLAEGANLEDVQAGLSDSFSGRAEVERPAGRGEDVDDSLESFRFSLNLAGSVSLFVGLLIIYNNVVVSVEERRSQIATLRALGARRSRILSLVLGEAAALGLAGGVVGTLLGVAMGRPLTAAISGLSSALSRISLTDVGITPGTLLAGVALGMAAAVVASIGPAWSAIRVHPLEALAQAETPRTARGRIVTHRVGLTLGVVGIAILAAFAFPQATGMSAASAGQLEAFGSVGIVLLMTGTLLFLPSLLSWTLARVRVRSVPWRLALDNLARSPGRTSAAVAGMMVALAMMIATAAQTDAVTDYARQWVDTTIGWDMMVSSSFFGTTADVPLDPDFVDTVRDTEGVAHAALFRLGSTVLEDSRVPLSSFEMDEMLAFMEFDVVDGDVNALRERLTRGEYVAISTLTARRFDLGVGDTVTLSTPSGPIDLKVAALIRDSATDTGVIYMDQPAYARLWGDTRVDGIDVKLAEGYEIGPVVDRMEETLGADRHVVIRTREEFTAGVMDIMRQSTGMMNALVYIAVLVAAAGIMNTALISLWQHKREVSTLRAVGARMRQVGRMLLAESLVIGAAGAVLGGVIGVLVGKAIILGANAATGTLYEFHMPWAAMAAALALGAGLGALGSLVPARAASRTEIVAGLRYE